MKARRSIADPATKAPAAPMTGDRRRALGLSSSPGMDTAIGAAFWGAFLALFLAFVGVIF